MSVYVLWQPEKLEPDKQIPLFWRLYIAAEENVGNGRPRPSGFYINNDEPYDAGIDEREKGIIRTDRLKLGTIGVILPEEVE